MRTVLTAGLLSVLVLPAYGDYNVGVSTRAFKIDKPYNWRGAQTHALVTTIWYPAAPAAVEQPKWIGPLYHASPGTCKSTVLTDYETAWHAKDAAALARLFAEDGFVLSPGHPMIRGRKAIETFYGGHGGPLFLRAVTYAVDGNVGYIIGAYTGRAGAPDDGKFTLTLRRDASGRWLIMSDMDNGNRPPPGAHW